MSRLPSLRRAALLASLATVLAVAPLSGATDTTRLLAQYDFENIPAFIPNWGAGLGSTYKPATGWKTPFKVSLDTADPHSGAHALRFDLLETADGEKIVHSPAITIPEPAPGTGPATLVLHVFVRSKGLVKGGAGIRILERNAKGASIRLLENDKSLITIPPVEDWSELTAEGVLHSATRSVSFMVVMYDQPAPATLWIDDVSMELKPAPLAK